MSSKATKQEVFGGDKSPYDQIRKDAEAAKNETILLTATVEKLAAELTKISTAAAGIKSIKAVDNTKLAAMEAENNQLLAAIELLKQETAAKRALVSAEKQLTTSKEKQRLEEIRLQQAREKAFDRAEKQIQQAERQSQAYNRVNGWLKKLSDEHKNLAVRQQLFNNLTTEEAKRMQVLEGRIQRYDTALKNVDATQGKHQRKVGDYATAWNGLGNSVQQLSREMPAFANSMQTGFMAISNNLPMFFDEIKKAKQANIDLAASGQPTTSVLKQIGQSIFSTTGLLSIGVTLLTVFGAKLFELFSSSEKTSASMKRQNEIRKYQNEQIKKSAEYVGKESAEYVGYILQLKKTNSGSKERSNLISEINKKYGATLKNIKDETRFQAQLNNEIKQYIAFQRLRFEAEKIGDLINRNLTKQDELRTKVAKSLGISAKMLDAYADVERKQMEQRQRALDSGTMSYEEFNRQQELSKQQTGTLIGIVHDYVLEQNASNERLENYGLDMKVVNDELKKYGYNTNLAASGNDKLNVSLNTLSNTMSNQIDLEDRIIKLRQDLFEMEAQKQIDAYNRLREEELKIQIESIKDSLSYEADSLEFYRSEELRKFEEFEREKAQFRISELRKSLNDDYLIKLDSINNDRNAELAKINESKASESEKNAAKLELARQYSHQISLLNSQLTGKEKAVALEIEKVNIELDNKIVEHRRESNEQKKADALAIDNAMHDATLQALEDFYKEEKILQLNSNKTDEEIAKQSLEAKKKELEEKIYLEEAYAKDEEEAKKKTVDMRLQLAELNRQINQKELEDQKKFFAEVKKLTDKALDEILNMWKKQSEDREKIIDRNIENSKREEDQLIAQANSGSDTAKQSLALQKQTTKELLDDKEKEQRRQEAIEKAKIAYQIVGQLIGSGKNVVQATGETIASMSFIDGIISKLKGFYGGTKRTVGEELGDPILPGKDGHIIRVDGAEKILNPALSRMTGDATTDQIVDGYLMSKQFQSYITAGLMPRKQDVTHHPLLPMQLAKLDKIVEKLDELPKEQFSEGIRNGVLSAWHSSKSGNTHLETVIQLKPRV